MNPEAGKQSSCLKWRRNLPGADGRELKEFAPMWRERSTAPSVRETAMTQTSIKKQALDLGLDKNALEPLKARVPEAKDFRRYFCSLK